MKGINICLNLLVVLLASTANGQSREDDLSIRLTDEIEVVPPGVDFSPIPVVPFPKLKPRPTKRPMPQPPTSTQRPRRPLLSRPSPMRPPTAPTTEPLSVPFQPTVQQPSVPLRPPQMQYVEVPFTMAQPEIIKPADSSIPKPKPETSSFPEVTTYRPKEKPYDTITSNKGEKPKGRLLFKVSRQDDDGGYFFDFVSDDSIHRMERGYFKKDPDSDDLIHVKTGLYSFESPEGNAYRVDYIADENGYRTFDPPPMQTPFPLIDISRNNI